MLNSFLSIFLVLALVGCSSAPRKKARNAIFFIGDGMGHAQITGARLFKGGPKAKLNFERMSYTGLSKTYSSDNYTTDSAAAATALATGVKTFNGTIGMSDPAVDPKGKSRKLQTILDLAHRSGKWLGVVSSARVTHATPAAFYAHVPQRDSENDIAAQVKDSHLKLLLGGGQKKFDQATLSSIQKSGWTYVKSEKELYKASSDQRILGLFSQDHLPFDIQKEKSDVALDDLVSFAIDFLSKGPNGYVLIVEGGRIDHASHHNFAALAFGDVISLDRSVGVALDKGGKDTLVVVTADHETGGLSLSGYGAHEKATGHNLLGNLTLSLVDESENHPIIVWGTGPGGKSPVKAPNKKDLTEFRHKAAHYHAIANHTAVDVAIMSNGPGAEKFTGFMVNSQIPKRMAEVLGLQFDDPTNLENFKVQIEKE